MTVCFDDLLRQTRCKFDDVKFLESEYAKINGRVTKVWHITFMDGRVKSFKMKDYSVYWVRAD